MHSSFLSGFISLQRHIYCFTVNYLVTSLAEQWSVGSFDNAVYEIAEVCQKKGTVDSY